MAKAGAISALSRRFLRTDGKCPQSHSDAFTIHGARTIMSVMRRTIRSPADFQTAPVPFMHSDLEARGLTEFALKDQSRFLQVFRGVWVEADPSSRVLCPPWADQKWLLQQVRLSALLLLHPNVIGCSLTAAALYGLPLPSRRKDFDTHVISDNRGRRIRRKAVQLHRGSGFDITEFYNLPLVSATDLFFELAPLISEADLIALGDAAISRQNSGPLTSLDQLREKAAASQYLKARKSVRRALSLIRETVDSPRETWLRLWIIANGFPEPEVHPEVKCSTVSATLRPDLGYPDIKLAIEYEGDHHRTSSYQFGADIERRQLLEAEGWVVLRVSKRTDMGTFKHILAIHLG
ncbi:hypothetical protein [Brevibacterium permense]|uniref:DUF559 domain-containing protein n=2 Tax=Brevibacterium permense TaxID=234834 RepID=A0ABN2A383_9MICO|nr:hypothetical protein [Brevibacterium permense]